MLAVRGRELFNKCRRELGRPVARRPLRVVRLAVEVEVTVLEDIVLAACCLVRRVEVPGPS